MAVSLALLVLVAYLLAAGTLAVNFPYLDDYYAVLDSLAKVRASETVGEKAAAVFSQHNEHRVAWLRVIALTFWGVQGQVDFCTLIWLGNLGLVALTVILAAGARRSVQWPSLLALIPLALLSPIQGKQMIWAMAAISNYWVLAFAALALLLLSKGTRTAFNGACALAVIATFTSGQGLICFPAGLALLLVDRRWPRALNWAGLMGISAFAYFLNYTRPPHHPAPQMSWTAVQFFPAAAGSALSDMLCRCLAPVLPNPRWQAALDPSLQAATGLALIGAVAWLWARRYYQRNPFVSVFLLYLLLLCATASLSRSSFGLEHALVAHYKVTSASLAVLVAIALLDCRYPTRSEPCPQTAALLGGSLFCVLSWLLFLPDVKAFSIKLAEGRNWFVQHQDGRGVLTPPLRQQGLDILWRSYLTGLLPLSDLGTEEIRLVPERLLRIATSGAQPRSAPMPPAARLVGSLQWTGDELFLIPDSSSDGGFRASGRLWVQQGKLQYVLPDKAPTASMSREGERPREP